MRFRIGITVGLVLLLGACSTSEPTAGPEEPATLAELDARVRLGALELLERESIPIAVIYFGFTDREEIVRYEWIDYRPGGDLLSVVKPLDDGTAIAVARGGGNWQSATDSSPWETDLSLSESSIPVIAQLVSMTTQTTPGTPGNDATVQYEATRQAASDGSELWTLLIPNPGGPLETEQWIINPDGVLQFYRIYFDTPQLGGDVGTIVVEYGVQEEDPDPVIIPELGTPLSLDDLEIPEPLRDLEG